MDSLKPAPPSVKLRLESEPSGARAATSAGPGCNTPCEVSVPADKDLTVTYTLDRFLPQTVNVARVDLPGESIEGIEGVAKIGFDPNPVIAVLEPAPPPKRGRASRHNQAGSAATAPRRAAPARPAAARPATSRPAAPPPASGSDEPSPFPPPPSR